MDGVGRFREVLPMLMDPVAFAGAVVSGDAVGGCRVPSRGMERHRATLRSCGVASDARSRPAFAMKAFTTPKKDGRTARLVLDARPLNDAMRRPPSMDLPRLRDFIAEVERHRFAMQCDGVSYFYQFPIDASISRYFGIGMKGCDMLLNVLCMGWSWAPCIAQRASNVLVRDLGLAWWTTSLSWVGRWTRQSGTWPFFGSGRRRRGSKCGRKATTRCGRFARGSCVWVWSSTWLPRLDPHTWDLMRANRKKKKRMRN
ncbi:hypothetical protein DIPPA_30564 [Diplonema papillatum]|nr:hypothetical protein DIPPA_30564 [Diplonema papillatum]